ncbi:hypothetical protein R5R73_11430 [Salinicola sp. LHM]|uniref:hypothetical protein n=1 Tax=Salinicola sp. LHM TaxID=3065298 RepID=UPI002ACD6D8F|nr:hypothetical protein [Salinicola sp. LHM]WQH31680.1 hypothetical protein R5R73_11430 [Salinicola sp. LHM]
MVNEGAVFYVNNVEEDEEYFINPDYWRSRPEGLSAVLRVKDEDEWLELSVLSIIKWCDEVLICIQGRQADNTEEVSRSLANQFPEKIRMLYFPYDSLPNGPGHNLQLKGSIYERAYFYNWCFSKSRYSHAMKWDGDMVAMDWLGETLREHILSNSDTDNIVAFHGVDIVGRELSKVTEKLRTASEPRFFKVTEETFYYSGETCERFSMHGQTYPRIEKASFMHLKWTKDITSISTAWKKGWENEDQSFFKGFIPSRFKSYVGEYPDSLKQLKEDRQKNNELKIEHDFFSDVCSVLSCLKTGRCYILGLPFLDFPYDKAKKWGVWLDIRTDNADRISMKLKEDVIPVSSVKISREKAIDSYENSLLLHQANSEYGVLIFNGFGEVSKVFMDNAKVVFEYDTTASIGFGDDRKSDVRLTNVIVRLLGR